MKLVIDIPEEYRGLYETEKCKSKFDSLATNEFGYVLRKAFKNGTPLPKGHGRLIDSKQAEERLRQVFDEHEGYNSLARFIVRNQSETPTIIEADKGEQE